MRFFLASELYSTPDLLHIFFLLLSYLVFGCIYLPPISFLFNGPPLVRLMRFIFSFFFFLTRTPEVTHSRVPPEFLMAVLPTPFSFLVTTKNRRTRTKRTQNLKKGPRSLYGMPLYFLKPCFGQHVRFLLCLRRVRACIADHGIQNPCLSMLLPMRS